MGGNFPPNFDIFVYLWWIKMDRITSGLLTAFRDEQSLPSEYLYF
jgi:hypothetical protein